MLRLQSYSRILHRSALIDYVLVAEKTHWAHR
jgi:hypothetical protein